MVLELLYAVGKTKSELLNRTADISLTGEIRKFLLKFL